MLAVGAKANRVYAACAVAFRDAHRLRCASAIFLRVDALNLRLFLRVMDGATSAFAIAIHLGGRPRRFPRLLAANRSIVRIASSRRSFSERSSARMLWISMANQYYTFVPISGWMCQHWRL
jgi:hypothetical protein